MAPSFVITLREGLEAALIVSIIVAYLTKTGHRDKLSAVSYGVGSAVLMSIVAAAAIFFTAGEIEGRPEELFEGFATLAAAGILTYMIFWMRKQAINIRSHLQAQVHSALESGSLLALGALAFVAVGREGLETALFMFAVTKTATPFAAALGGLLGLGGAIVLGYLLYKGTYRLDLRTFFNVTSILLLFFAAGLLAHGIHEFHEAGLVPPIVEHIWNTNAILDEHSAVGSFLKAILGYSGDPSLFQVIAYGLYVAVVGWSYFRPPSRRELELATKSARA